MTYFFLGQPLLFPYTPFIFCIITQSTFFSHVETKRRCACKTVSTEENSYYYSIPKFHNCILTKCDIEDVNIIPFLKSFENTAFLSTFYEPVICIPGPIWDRGQRDAVGLITGI